MERGRGGSNDQILEKDVSREGDVSADHKQPEVMSHGGIWKNEYLHTNPHPASSSLSSPGFVSLSEAKACGQGN